MGNEQSSSPELRMKNADVDKPIVILANGMEPPRTPQYCKRRPRTCSQQRAAPCERSLNGSVSSLTNPDGTPKREPGNKVQFLSPQPGADRRRSRSLCAQQIQQDAAALLSAGNKDEMPRKNSIGGAATLAKLRIQQSFKAARPTIGEAILRRAAAARSDFRFFLARLPEETMAELSRDMYILLSVAVETVEKSDKMVAAATRFGESHAALVPAGFRPDFFSALADAAIAECVRLDGGTHKRCETLIAWSQLVTTIFSSVRDGYYSRVRVQRRASVTTLISQQPMTNGFASTPPPVEDCEEEDEETEE